jgi:hypothetical protein
MCDTKIHTKNETFCDGVNKNEIVSANLYTLIFVHNLNSQFHTTFQMTTNDHGNCTYSRRTLFTSIHHKLNCDICCCVEWISLVFLDAACYPDVYFHIHSGGRVDSSSCYATSMRTQQNNFGLFLRSINSLWVPTTYSKKNKNVYLLIILFYAFFCVIPRRLNFICI